MSPEVVVVVWGVLFITTLVILIAGSIENKTGTGSVCNDKSQPYVKCEEISQGFFQASVFETSWHEEHGFSHGSSYGFNKVKVVRDAWAEHDKYKRDLAEADEWKKIAPPPTYYTKENQ